MNPDAVLVFVDARTLAHRLGVSRAFVYEHADELGAIRLRSIGGAGLWAQTSSCCPFGAGFRARRLPDWQAAGGAPLPRHDPQSRAVPRGGRRERQVRSARSGVRQATSLGFSAETDSTVSKCHASR